MLRRVAQALCLYFSGYCFACGNENAQTSLAGSWSGTFRCQNPAGMSIEIAENSEFGTHQAVVYIHALGRPSSNGLKYYAKVKWDTRSRTVYLTPTGWVRERPNYVMYGFAGRVSPRGDRIDGRITYAGCGAVAVERPVLDASEPEPSRGEAPSLEILKSLFDLSVARKQ